MHDPIFLGGKSTNATKDDLQVAEDLLDTAGGGGLDGGGGAVPAGDGGGTAVGGR